jgi:hypothetical protein
MSRVARTIFETRDPRVFPAKRPTVDLYTSRAVPPDPRGKERRSNQIGPHHPSPPPASLAPYRRSETRAPISLFSLRISSPDHSRLVRASAQRLAFSCSLTLAVQKPNGFSIASVKACSFVRSFDRGSRIWIAKLNRRSRRRTFARSRARASSSYEPPPRTRDRGCRRRAKPSQSSGASRRAAPASRSRSTRSSRPG